MTDKSKEAFIYLWRDRLNKKWYLGKHKGSPDDDYTHSSDVMPRFKKKYTPYYMKRRIVAFGTHEEICILEGKLLKSRQNKEFKWKQYYNERTGKLVKNRKKKNKLIPLSDEQLSLLLNHVSNFYYGHIYRIIVSLSFYAGLSTDDIHQIKMTDIYDFEQCDIKREIKIGEDTVPISNILKKEISKFINTDGVLLNEYVCVSQKGRFNSQTLQNLFRKWFNELGLSDYSSMTGRNTFIYKLLSSSIDMTVAHKLTRHTTISQLTYYMDRFDTDRGNTVNVLNLIWGDD